MRKKLNAVLIFLAVGLVLVILGRLSLERRLLFYPTHDAWDPASGLSQWIDDGQVIGFSRTVDSPKNVWLMFHGNAGQAADRAYAIPGFSPEDSVFIMEYPGFGQRSGTPSMPAIQSAATQAYQLLRRTYPNVPVCAVGESIGTGPACFLATFEPPPDKLVLIVPFDNLPAVAREYFPPLMVRLLLTHKWDNVAALARYKGPVQIFAAANDTIIRPQHAKGLAEAISNSTLTMIDGGHNDWPDQARVKIRNP